MVQTGLRVKDQPGPQPARSQRNGVGTIQARPAFYPCCPEQQNLFGQSNLERLPGEYRFLLSNFQIEIN